MTAWGSVEGAVAAVRRGARDYVQKPWDNARLLQTLATQIELGRALRVGQRLEQENRLLRREGAPEMIAESAVMRPVLELIHQVAPSEANVLVTGEHGTGKELVARILHAESARATRALAPTARGASNWPMVARCSWMRSRTFRCRNRPSCYACCRAASSSALDSPARAA